MKKVWLVLLAVVLVFGLAMLGCGSKSSGGPGEPCEHIEFESEKNGFSSYDILSFTQNIG